MMTSSKCLLIALIAIATVFPTVRGAESEFNKDSLQPGDRVGICGDSITEQHLYSLYVADYLMMCQPQPKLTAIQFGWGGEQATGFLERMKNDALPFRPTVATTCYGMNDGGYTSTKPDRIDRYRKAMTDIVDTLKGNGVRFIVVGSPGAVDSFTYDAKPEGPDVYNKTLGDFAQVAKEVAAKEGVRFADVHGAMMGAMTKAKAALGAEYPLCNGNGVHPYPNGHLIMAYAFLKALGCDGNIGTITVDLKTHQAVATSGTEVISYDKGDLQLQSTRYPFCFHPGDVKDPNSNRSILPYVPFNQELNRYVLVVKNSPALHLNITWGAETKTFSSAEMAKGINLAAEFLDNPFREKFEGVQNHLAGLQNLETQLSKTLMHSLVDWNRMVPGAQEILEPVVPKLLAQSVAKWQSERDAVVAEITPVKHVLKIEPVP